MIELIEGILEHELFHKFCLALVILVIGVLAIRIIGKIQLTAPGYSAPRGKFRNYVGVLSDEGFVSFVIHDFRSVCSLDLKEYQVHLRYLFIDAESGPRSRDNTLTEGIEI